MLQSERPFVEARGKRARATTQRRHKRLSPVFICMISVTLLVIVGIIYSSAEALNEEFFHLPVSQEEGLTQPFLPVTQERVIDGYHVSLLKAYADVNQVVVLYRVADAKGNPVAAQDLLPTLSAAGQEKLPWLSHAEEECKDLLAGRSAFIFDATRLPVTGGVLQFHLQIKHVPPPTSLVQVDDALTVPVPAADFDFALPVHEGQSLQVNKSFTRDGETLTLTHLLLTETGARLFLKLSSARPGQRMQLAEKGVQVQVDTRYFDGFPSMASGSPGETSYLVEDISRNKPGLWVLMARPRFPHSEDVIPLSPTWRISFEMQYL
ncbi:hypothetical protein [Ktedonobacter sp. SOSP1-52]|uniref:hypothetical protein n=1 Tax=Ktedonobacter sp. SOSP1-52 TaxID=2778366 RepID=UPI0019158D43|nr:hypothetical protein [Ktedonobacter sp. SOSP1-52]